jgi:hypothetical protein
VRLSSPQASPSAPPTATCTKSNSNWNRQLVRPFAIQYSSVCVPAVLVRFELYHYPKTLWITLQPKPNNMGEPRNSVALADTSGIPVDHNCVLRYIRDQHRRVREQRSGSTTMRAVTKVLVRPRACHPPRAGVPQRSARCSTMSVTPDKSSGIAPSS